MKIINHKDAINRYNNQSFVETAIYRVSCLNQTVLDLDPRHLEEFRGAAILRP